MKRLLSILLVASMLSAFSVGFAAGAPSDPGDITLDGSVTLADVVLTARCCIGSSIPTEEQKAIADMNADGILSLADVIIIARIAIGSIEPSQTDIYVLSSTQALTLHERPDYTIDKTLRIELAKNEAEAAQFTVFSATRTYQNMKLSVSSLESDDGTVIPAENVKLYKEYYSVTQSDADTITEEPKAYLLFPLEYEDYNNTTTVPGENTTYQIDVTADADTPAGTYKGTVTLKHDQGVIELPISVTIWDITLPESPTYRSLWDFWPSDIANRLQNVENSEQEYTKAVQDAWALADEYKVNLWAPYKATEVFGKFGQWNENVELYIQNLAAYINAHPHYTACQLYPFYHSDGSTNFSSADQAIYMTESDKQRNLEVIAMYEEYGILDNAYIYVVDEPHTDQQFESMKVVGDFLKENGLNEKVHNLVTSTPRSKSEGTTNTWCPIVSYFDPDEARETRQEDGSDYWWYFCNDAPWPTFGKDVELSNTRMNAWFAKQYDLKGILYWIANAQGWDNGVSDMGAYQSDRSLMILGREGDGVLNRNITVASLSATAVRDATEDYDLLIYLEQRVAEFLDKTGIDMTLEQAMEAYYTALANSTKEFATFEAPYNIPVMRSHIAQTIMNGVDYVMTEQLLSNDGKYNEKQIKIYVEKGAEVQTPSHAVFIQKEEAATYDVYTYVYTFEARCEMMSFQIGTNQYTRPMSMSLSIQDDGQSVLNLDEENALELLKQANPELADSISIENRNGQKTIVFQTSSQTNTPLEIPTALLTTLDFSGYTNLGVTMQTESQQKESLLSFDIFVLSNRDSIKVGDATFFEPDSKTISGDLTEYPNVMKRILKIRIMPDKTKTPVKIAISDICLYNAIDYTGDLVT